MEMMQIFNRTFFRFLLGFLAILAFSITLTLIVQKYEASSAYIGR